MNILQIAILFFVIMESSNVIILWFKPDFKYGNSIAVFDDWKRTEGDNEMRLFAKYLVNWVANVKLIFIMLLVAVMIWGSALMQLIACIVMVLSISIYYISLHPIIRKLDKAGHITPKGYSKTLFITITIFMIIFASAIVIYLI